MPILLTIFLILGIIYFALHIYRFFNKPKQVSEPPTENSKFGGIILIDDPIKPGEDYYGPPPTHEQRRITLNRFVEFFKQFPESPLKESYPQQANMAIALKRYSELDLSLKYGEITQEAYDEEVEKLLPLIDISEDFPPSEK
jgi:hypothetical protein